MITLFLKRDFEQLAFPWAFLGLMTFVGGLFYLYKPNSEVISLLSMFYFLFPALASPNILGSVGRGEMALSRAYLQSLPVKKNKLYLIMILRSAILYAPLWIFSSWLAFRFFSSFQKIPDWLVYCLSILVSVEGLFFVLWSVCYQIRLTIQIEETWRFSSATKRFVSILKISLSGIFQFAIILALPLLGLASLVQVVAGKEVGEVLFFLITRIPITNPSVRLGLLILSTLFPLLLLVRMFFLARKKWIALG